MDLIEPIHNRTLKVFADDLDVDDTFLIDSTEPIQDE